jgi:hypothetical protein
MPITIPRDAAEQNPKCGTLRGRKAKEKQVAAPVARPAAEPRPDVAEPADDSDEFTLN